MVILADMKSKTKREGVNRKRIQIQTDVKRDRKRDIGQTRKSERDWVRHSRHVIEAKKAKEGHAEGQTKTMADTKGER